MSDVEYEGIEDAELEEDTELPLSIVNSYLGDKVYLSMINYQCVCVRVGVCGCVWVGVGVGVYVSV